MVRLLKLLPKKKLFVCKVGSRVTYLWLGSSGELKKTKVKFHVVEFWLQSETKYMFGAKVCNTDLQVSTHQWLLCFFDHRILQNKEITMIPWFIFNKSKSILPSPFSFGYQLRLLGSSNNSFSKVFSSPSHFA